MNEPATVLSSARQRQLLRLKPKQLREYGDTVKDPDTTCEEHSNNPRCYEEDPLIPIEDGGNPFDPRNLWPEPTNKMPRVNGAGWETKDFVEILIGAATVRRNCA